LVAPVEVNPDHVSPADCPWHGRLYAKRAAEWRLLADNPLRLTQVATGPVVPLTSLLSLFEFDVGSQVQPFQTATRTAHLDVGWAAVASSYGVVSDAAELGAEGAVGGTAQFGLPHERCLRHSPRSAQSSAPRTESRQSCISRADAAP